MFKFLRSQAKVFYWVIAATFILFLFLGGMTGRGCTTPGSGNFEAGVVGSVNGTKIPAQQYDFAVRQQIAQMRQQNQNRELNANHYATARQRAWDALVQNAIVEQAIAERKIKVTDQEVLDVFQNNPPQELLAQYRDEQGNIDMNQYYADLQNPENDWSRAEEYIRTLLPRQKLTEEISAGAAVSDEEVREEYLRQTGRAVAEFMGVNFADLEQEYQPTDDEITAWYNDHPDDYRVEERAQCSVVRFAKNPSDLDYEEILQYMNEIRQEILDGTTDFAAAAQEYSEDPGSAARGGDLGTFDRNRMVAPFTEVAFSLPVGEISEPVKTQFGYHIIEVTEQIKDEDSGEVTEIAARHILLKVTPGPDTIQLIQESAEDFRARVDGGSFASTAEAEALDLVQPAPFQKGRDIPTIPLSLTGSNWAFDARPGEVSLVFENTDFFYVVLAGEPLPAGLRPLTEVESSVTLAVTREHNLEVAKAMLSPLAGEVQMGRSMAEVAASAELVHGVTDTFTVNGNIPEIGYGTDFNKAVIDGQVGQLIPEIETQRGVYSAVPIWIHPFDEVDFLARRSGIQAALLSRAQNEVVDDWFQAQLEAAVIVDNRHAMLQGS